MDAGTKEERLADEAAEQRACEATVFIAAVPVAGALNRSAGTGAERHSDHRANGSPEDLPPRTVLRGPGQTRPRLPQEVDGRGIVTTIDPLCREWAGHHRKEAHDRHCARYS